MPLSYFMYSELEFEYEETLQKAKAFLEALGDEDWMMIEDEDYYFGIDAFETIAVENGTPQFFIQYGDCIMEKRHARKSGIDEMFLTA